MKRKVFPFLKCLSIWLPFSSSSCCVALTLRTNRSAAFHMPCIPKKQPVVVVFFVGVGFYSDDDGGGGCGGMAFLRSTVDCASKNKLKPEQSRVKRCWPISRSYSRKATMTLCRPVVVDWIMGPYRTLLEWSLHKQGMTPSSSQYD